jgi:hypothetical protein
MDLAQKVLVVKKTSMPKINGAATAMMADWSTKVVAQLKAIKITQQ